MSAPVRPWTLWQIRPGGRVEHVGPFDEMPRARRTLLTSIPRGAVLDPDGDVEYERGDLEPREAREIERAWRAWAKDAGAVTSLATTQPYAVEIPAPAEEEPVGLGAATEVPSPTEPEAPLPAPFEPPLDELMPTFAERAEAVRAQVAEHEAARAENPPIVPAPRYDEVYAEGTHWLDGEQPEGARPIPEAARHELFAVEVAAQNDVAEIEALRVRLAEETAARVAAEGREADLAASLRERTEQLGSARERMKALREYIRADRTELTRTKDALLSARAEATGLTVMLREEARKVEAYEATLRDLRAVLDAAARGRR